MSVNLKYPCPVAEVGNVFSQRVEPSGRHLKAVAKACIFWDGFSWMPLNNNLRRKGFVLARKAWQPSGEAGGRNRKLASHFSTHAQSRQTEQKPYEAVNLKDFPQ